MSNTEKYFTALFCLLGVLLFCLCLSYGQTQNCYEGGCIEPGLTTIALIFLSVGVVGLIVVSFVFWVLSQWFSDY